MEERMGALGGFATVGLLSVGFVADFVVMAQTSGPPTVRADHLTGDLARAAGSGVWPVECWLYLLATAPFVVFLAALRQRIKAAGSPVLADAAALSGLGFIVLHTVHNAAATAVVQGLAPHAHEPGVVAVARGFVDFGNTVFSPGGGMGNALLVVFLLCAAWTSHGAARNVGLVAAGASALGYFQYLVPPALAIALIGWVALLVWVALSSFAMAPADARQKELASILSA